MPIPITSIISVLTNFILYWTFHPEYQQQVYTSIK
jgi:hypothetical protein